jgi:hypothetical protein
MLSHTVFLAPITIYVVIVNKIRQYSNNIRKNIARTKNVMCYLKDVFENTKFDIYKVYTLSFG